MKLILCDIDHEVVAAWRDQFSRHPAVEVRERSILEAVADCMVNPGNSFGFMDGGLALKIADRFGFALEESIRNLIRDRYGGEMLVGQAAVVPTGGQPSYLIYAPTMRTPQMVRGTMNAYLASRAAFAVARAFNEASGNQAAGTDPIRTIAFPGLCTGTGKMPPLISARQIRYAFEEAMGLRKVPDQNLSRLARREKKLKELPARDESED